MKDKIQILIHIINKKYEMKVTAVIPIRKGSERVKDKNLRSFADTNLLELKIKNLLQVSEIDEIVVNTDSDKAIEIACKNGVSYHRRETYYASSQCSGSDFFQHLGKVTLTDLFVYCPVTSPFVKPETISKCINQFKESEGIDSLATVSLVKEFMWLDGQPINYNPLEAPNSQNLPDVVALNFAVSVIHRNDLIHQRNIIGKKPSFVIISELESVDIDTPLDFYLAEQIYIKTVREGKGLLE